MHYSAGIFDKSCLGCSHILAISPCYFGNLFVNHAKCCIQGCIRMEQGNLKEDESVIQKSYFLGVGFRNSEIKPGKIINELDAENYEGKQKGWDGRIIAEKLRRLADNFEVEFQNISESTQSQWDKITSQYCFRIIKFVADIISERLFFYHAKWVLKISKNSATKTKLSF